MPLARVLLLLSTITSILVPGIAAARDLPSAATKAPLALAYKDIFRRSISERSGDIFLLPERLNSIYAPYDFEPKALHASHIASKHDGKVDIVLPPHPITMHGVAWDYDLRIPITFYDPKARWLKPGTYPAVAVQQDIVPTLADVLGIPAPDRAEGRILKEARTAGNGRPRVIAVIVQDQMGQQYYAAHPQRAPFLRSLMSRGANFPNAQVAHVDVETAVGHAAVGSGAYARGHGITGNDLWNSGTWSTSPAFTAVQGESPRLEGYPMNYGAATLADVWARTREDRPAIFSLVSASRASLALGGHGSGFAGAKKSAVVYLQDYGPDAGSYITNTNFYTLPAAFKGQNVLPYAEKFQKEHGGNWFGNELIGADGKPNLQLIKSSPALVRFESDLVDAAIDELAFGADEETDLLFVNFKSSDYCGHNFGFESEECGEVLEAIDAAVNRLVTKLELLSRGELIVTLTADHGAAPIIELSGGRRCDGQKLLDALNQRFDKRDNHIDAVQNISSSQVWVNRKELALNGVSIADVVKFLKNYEVPMQAPYNMLATEWLAKGVPLNQRFFRDVVSRDELAAAAPHKP